VIANIDLDGVVYDFDGAMGDLCARITGRPREDFPKPTTWHMNEDWNMTPEEWRKLFKEAIFFGIFDQGEDYAIDGALEGVTRLKEAGYRIRFVSHKMFPHTDGWNEYDDWQAVTDAITWMRRAGFLDLANDLAFVGGDKRHYRANLVVDDKPATFEWAQPYALNLLYPHPYNERFNSNPSKAAGVVRVINWDHVATLGEQRIKEVLS
jgi:hypothetical protein